MQRFRDLAPDRAQDLISRGIPFVVEDGTRGWPMEAWDCEYFTDATAFRGARLRREYDNHGDVNQVQMRDAWTGDQVPIKGGEAIPPNGPRFQPFYWDIVKAWRDERHRGWGADVPAQIRHVQESTRVPYFLPAANLPEMRQNPEFWLQPPGAGTQAHLDEHCISTITATLSGAKRWRLQLVPPEPDAAALRELSNV